MGTATCREITFTGTLQVHVAPSTHCNGRPDFRHREGDPFAVSIDQGRVPEGAPASRTLWLLSPEMQFDGTVSATGNLAAIAEWQAGFIQTITLSDRMGVYERERTWHLRLDTQFGSLKDGSPDSLFYGDVEQLARDGDQARATVSSVDAPNYRLPTMYTGDPARPGGDGATRLMRTDGEDHFTTWLAVTHLQSRSVVLLGQSKWTVSWAGRFDPVSCTWASAGAMNVHLESDVAAAYPDLRQPNHPPVPFSMRMAEAEDSAVIRGPAKWETCKPSGKLKAREGADLTLWTQEGW